MKKIILSIFILGNFAVKAQITNTGQEIFVGNSALLYVSQDYTHQSGSIYNKGEVRISGNWKNNDSNSVVFDIRSTGVVKFSGNQQQVGGLNKTAFPSLELGGTAFKTLNVNTDVVNQLILNDIELKVGQSTLSILSGNVNAITRSSGYISTDLRGKLTRNLKENGSYIFPFGSSQNLQKATYRPISIEQTSSASGAFTGTFFGIDPNLINYNRSDKRTDVNEIYDKYFYILNQETSQTPVKVRFYQTEKEVAYSQLVTWSGFNLWEKAANTVKSTGTFGDELTGYIEYASVKSFTGLPFAFSSNLFVSPLVIYNAFSPDGDGKNDTWEIKNLDTYPDNELTVFNRYGDEVYKAKGYSSAKAWTGGNLPAGTYFYVLKVSINSMDKVYKGFITMAK